MTGIDVRTYGLTVAGLTLAVVLTACVPEPTNRPSPSGGGSVATAAPTAVPTLAGPTPTLSFIRPTPTPRPTFFIYTVVTGDTLVKIAKRHGTSGRSIAYWNRATYPSLDPDSDKYRPDYLAIGWTLVLIPNTEVDPENLPPGPSTTGIPDESPAEESVEEPAVASPAG